MRYNKIRKSMDFHGLSNTKLYHRWTAIVSRVTDPDNACYNNYGGRGIGICEEWRDFLKFRKWALESGYSEKLVIDRIDVNGNYCPENCRWVTKSESSVNRRKRNSFGIQKSRKKYQVTIVREGWHYYLGMYKTLQEAEQARTTFLIRYYQGKILHYKSRRSYN